MTRLTHGVSWAPWIVLAVAIAAACPGDAPWIADEPVLITMAMQRNAAGTIASYGLQGTQGALYGPLAVWLYQIYLQLSSNLVLLVAIRATAMVLLTTSSLLVISRLVRSSAWCFVLAIFSPFFWLYSRQVWDNTLCIPLAAWAFAGYALFLGGRRWGVAVSSLCSGLMIMTHLMSVPLISAIALHALLTQRQQLLVAVWYVIVPAALVAMAGAAYWPILVHGLHNGAPLALPSMQSLLFTLRGGDWIGGLSFVRVVGDEWFFGSPLMLQVLLTAMTCIHLLVIGGIVLAGTCLTQAFRTRAAWTLADQLSVVALMTLLLQFVYYGTRNAIGQIHYYNASWIAYAFLVGQFCHWLSQWRLGRAAVATMLALATCTLLALFIQLHRTGGTRSLTYGPTLANQQRVALAIAELPKGSRIVPLMPDIANIPGRITVLMDLIAPAPQRIDATPATAYIAYSSDNPADGRVRLMVEPSLSNAASVRQNAPMTR